MNRDDCNFLACARGLFRPADLRLMRQAYLAEAAQNDAGLGVATNRLRVRQRWYDVWRTASLNVIPREVRHFTHVIFPPMLRTIRDVGAFVPWHQDEAYIAQMDRRHEAVLTCWVPLNDEPARHPTLEFAMNAGGRREHQRDDSLAFNKLSIPDEQVGGKRVSFADLHLGDALLFGQHVLHRTAGVVQEDEPRYSVEFRLTTADGLLRDKDYFDLRTTAFVRTEA